MWESFGSAVVGGVLIGLAASVLLLFNKQVAGISGIVGRLMGPAVEGAGWRWAFLFGLIGTGLLFALFRPASFGDGASAVVPFGWTGAVVAGVLVGLGTRLGNGCTSGHGVCGVSRGSLRSIVATCVFIAAGMLTVWTLRQVGA